MIGIPLGLLYLGRFLAYENGKPLVLSDLLLLAPLVLIGAFSWRAFHRRRRYWRDLDAAAATSLDDEKDEFLEEWEIDLESSSDQDAPDDWARRDKAARRESDRGWYEDAAFQQRQSQSRDRW